VSQNQADFRLASSLYRQNLTMMKLAIGRQPGA
jgi:flagellar basal-body rod protein FlgB